MNEMKKKLVGRAMLNKIASIRKKAFTPGSQMAGGGMPPPPMDPAAGGAPMDPAMMGGAPPMDPAMAGMPPADPSMAGGMDMAGGAPPVDPATGMPMDPAAMGGTPVPQEDPMMIPITELVVGDLMAVISEAIGGGAGGGEAAPEEKKEGATESAPTEADDTNSRLDQIIELLGGAGGGAPMEAAPAGPAAGAPPVEGAPAAGMEVAASTTPTKTMADIVSDTAAGLRS